MLHAVTRIAAISARLARTAIFTALAALALASTAHAAPTQEPATTDDMAAATEPATTEPAPTTEPAMPRETIPVETVTVEGTKRSPSPRRPRVRPPAAASAAPAPSSWSAAPKASPAPTGAGSRSPSSPSPAPSAGSSGGSAAAPPRRANRRRPRSERPHVDRTAPGRTDRRVARGRQAAPCTDRRYADQLGRCRVRVGARLHVRRAPQGQPGGHEERCRRWARPGTGFRPELDRRGGLRRTRTQEETDGETDRPREQVLRCVGQRPWRRRSSRVLHRRRRVPQHSVGSRSPAERTLQTTSRSCRSVRARPASSALSSASSTSPPAVRGS